MFPDCSADGIRTTRPLDNSPQTTRPRSSDNSPPILRQLAPNMKTPTGVPDGAARQKTRSTGCSYAGWEILALDHLLAGIFVQRLAC